MATKIKKIVYVRSQLGQNFRWACHDKLLLRYFAFAEHKPANGSLNSRTLGYEPLNLPQDSRNLLKLSLPLGIKCWVRGGVGGQFPRNLNRSPDQFRCLGNCPPTPPRTQRQHLRLTWGKIWVRGGVGGQFP